MSPLDDAVKPTPPIVQIFSPSSTPGPAVASKPIANGPDADSDDRNKSDGDRQLLEKAMNHIIDTKTLTRLCNLEGVDAVRIRDTLIKNYTDTCQRQACRVTSCEVLHDNLLTALEQERNFDENVAAHYERFVRGMEEAEISMGKQHKQAMLTDAMKSIRLAQKNSHLARHLRQEVESTKAKLRRNDREMMAARDKLVKLLYGAFLYCLKVNIGTVKVEKGEDKFAY
ncbi:unnamed protein product [Alternaria alternata]